MVYPDSRVKETNPYLRDFGLLGLCSSPFSWWWTDEKLAMFHVVVSPRPMGIPVAKHWSDNFCLWVRRLYLGLDAKNNHLLCLCYLHAVLLQLQNWNVILISEEYSEPKTCPKDDIYPCFSEFLLNLDRCNCILLQVVTLKFNLYISSYCLSCNFTLNCRKLVKILKGIKVMLRLHCQLYTQTIEMQTH